MNRLAKKCVIASAGLHLLLVCILFIGPGFLSSKTVTPDLTVLDFVPVETVDELISGGGNPNANPPPAQPNVRPQPVETAPPPPPQQKPEPKVERTPEPEVRRQPEAKPEPKPEKVSLEPAPKERQLPKVSLKPVVRNPNTNTKTASAADRQAREYADYRRKLAQTIGSTANGIPGSISSSTSIEFKGPGSGGVPYANWLQAVKSDYTHAWVLPDGADDDATVTTTVTIGRDGRVISSRITQRSGNAVVDESVQSTLRRVVQTAPLPKTSSDTQRTVTIKFNVRAKRLLG